MKAKKCPYCYKRVSYISGMSNRRKSEYICTRCGKESKVVINKTIFLAFAVAVAVSAGIMLYWIKSGRISDPRGVLLVAAPLVIFMFITPMFLKYLPLKKYKKTMEAKKAGIVYSENIAGDISEEFTFNPNKISKNIENTSKIAIDSSVFNELKKKRDAERVQLQEKISGGSEADENEDSFVPVINNVSEEHASSDAPLKKLKSDSDSGFTRTRHYIPPQEDIVSTKKSETNKYTANRKF